MSNNDAESAAAPGGPRHQARHQARRLARSRRAYPPAAALLLSAVLMAGCSGSPAHPAASKTPGSAASNAAASSCVVPPAESCYAPRLFRVAYGIQPLLDQGIDGRGETVTVVANPPLTAAQANPTDVPPQPGAPTASAGPPQNAQPVSTDVRQDLAAFDRMFRLPAAQIQVVTTLAGSASPWQASANEVQDLEVVHTVAPAARLRVVLLPADVPDSAATATGGMLASLRLAVSHTDVAAIGWSVGEHFFTRAQVTQMHSILRAAAADHVTVAASSGDDGSVSVSTGPTPVKEVSLPASDPLALAVGGTTLTANPLTGAYISETTWNGAVGSFAATPGASGGGFSHLFTRPSYQEGVPGIKAMRGVPDVAGDANQQGGLPVVLDSRLGVSVNSNSTDGASTAMWAGVIALADQEAHHDLGFVNPTIYRIARGSGYHQAFHDVTTGENLTLGPVSYTYHAGPGWDPVTGWGSPNAQTLVPLLARG